jgi:hypothetical protein
MMLKTKDRIDIKFWRKISYFIFILIFLLPSVKASESHTKNIVYTNDTAYSLSAWDIKRGERLFDGLTYNYNAPFACSDCHYTRYIDTLNWNPSGLDIAHLYKDKNASDLISVLREPTGKILPEVHKNIGLSDEEIVLIKGYMNKLSKEKVLPRRPVIDKLLLFIFINIIGLFFTIDLLFLKKIPYRAIHLVVILGCMFYITRVIVKESINLGRQQNYAPLQPIKFSHKVHAGTYKIDCKYCHNLAETSKTAGIITVAGCLNCHSMILEGTNSGKFEIQKIIDANMNNEPVKWIKIHNLPDYVFFSHAQHVGAGKLDCSECHGVVEEMDVLRQENDLSMGWCLDCHRTRKVDFEDNAYYDLFLEYHEKIKNGEMDSVLVKDIGGENCMKCHY